MVRWRCSPTRAVKHSSCVCSIAPRRRYVDGLCGRSIGRRKKTSIADGSLLFRQSVGKFPRLQRQDQQTDLQPRADAALRSGQGKGCESNRHCQRLDGRCNPNRRDSKRECSRPKPAALKVRCRRDRTYLAKNWICDAALASPSGFWIALGSEDSEHRMIENESLCADWQF
jgi:hypothetical protein